MNNWFYLRAGQQVGPVSATEIRQLSDNGTLTGQDLVWHEGMAQWTPLATTEIGGGGVAVAQASPPPGQPVDYFTPTPQVKYGSFWLRFCAAIVDGLILAVFSYILGFFLGVALATTMLNNGASADDVELAAELIGNVLGILIAWIYTAAMESSRHQATLGKMAVGLIVTDYAGQRISFARATGRHFAEILSAIILLIGYLMVIFTERKQALHDLMAGTLVLQKPRY